MSDVSDPNEVPIDEVSGVEERPQNRREWAGAVRSLVLPVLLVAAIVGALVVLEERRGGGGAGDGYGIVPLPTALALAGARIGTDVGEVAPDFLLQSPDGEDLRLSDLRGRPVLVNFWASWCEPCRKEMPHIVRAWEERRASGFTVVAVDLQENAGAVREFAEEFGMDFPVVIDRRGEVATAWRIGGPVEGIPASYFLDEDGVVRARVFGPMTEAQLAEELEKLLP